MTYLLSNELKGETPAFMCPNCHLRASHHINGNIIYIKRDNKQKATNMTTIFDATCQSCEKVSYILQHSIVYSEIGPSDFDDGELAWRPTYIVNHLGPGHPGGTEVIVSQKVVDPENFADVPKPNSNLSADTLSLYNEAAKVLNSSPRASVALLRVAFETFLKDDLGLEGKSIYDMLGKLYSTGIPDEMDTALHFVRVAGNSADHTHPGEIQLDGDDGVETAKTLFEIINYVADEKITQKNKLTGLTRFFTPGQQQSITDLHDKNEIE